MSWRPPLDVTLEIKLVVGNLLGLELWPVKHTNQNTLPSPQSWHILNFYIHQNVFCELSYLHKNNLKYFVMSRWCTPGLFQCFVAWPSGRGGWTPTPALPKAASLLGHRLIQGGGQGRQIIPRSTLGAHRNGHGGEPWNVSSPRMRKSMPTQ